MDHYHTGKKRSDFSASILGAALKVDEIWLWKEVNGIMTTDLEDSAEARTILKSYEAWNFLISSNVLHPRTIELRYA